MSFLCLMCKKEPPAARDVRHSLEAHVEHAVGFVQHLRAVNAKTTRRV